MISDIKFQREFSAAHAGGVVRIGVVVNGVEHHCMVDDDEDGVASAFEALAKKLRAIGEKPSEEAA
jgi:hypothetical protein